MKKTLSLLFLAGTLCGILAPGASAQDRVVQKLWEKTPADHSFLGTNNTERGMAYNPLTHHLLVASRNGGTQVAVMNAEDGSHVGDLDVSGVAGGTFLINKVGVAEDGAIYVGNLTIDATGSSVYRLYRWENEEAAPVQVYSGHPGDGAPSPNHRFGDSLAIRGSGASTEILVGTWDGELLARLTPNRENLNEADSFSAQVITTDALSRHGRNITFGPGSLIYITYPSNDPAVPGHLYELEVDVVQATATTVRVFDGRLIARGLGPIGYDAGSDFFAGVRPFSHDVLIYRRGAFSDQETTVALHDVDFPKNESGEWITNGNGVGEAIVVGDRVYALHTNNSIMAIELVEPSPVAPGELYWTNIDEIRTSEIDGSNPRTVLGGLSRPVGIEIDPVGGHVYYADDGSGSIGRVDLNGENPTIVLSERANPQFLKIHDGRIYWTEYSNGLFSATLDGADIQPVIELSGRQSSGMVIDGTRGYAYLISANMAEDGTVGSGTIYRSTLDGQDLTTVSSLPSQTYGAALDVQSNTLYASSITEHRIFTKDLDAPASSEQDLPFSESLANPLGLALSNDGSRVFWVERNGDAGGSDQVGRVRVANIDGSNLQTLLSNESSPFGIAVVPETAGTGDGFAGWIEQRNVPADQRGPGDDPDRDSISNLVEYALGGDPGSADVRILPMTGIETVGTDDHLSLAISRNPDATGIDFVVEVSGDLITWDAGPGHTTTVTDTSDTLVVRDNTPMGDSDRRFIRLRIVEQ